MSPALATDPSTLDRFRDRWTWTAVVANLVGQILIIVTGGAVRLTGSGLGCSTWPECEPGEFTPRFHGATSIHPFIEFGNRTVSGLLVAVATFVAVLVVLDRRRSWSYRRLGLVPVLGVLVQAITTTVLVDLHPAIVGGHLLISMALVAFSTWLVVRTGEGDGPAVPLVDRTTRNLVRVLSVLAAVVLALGVVVTGAGPHSGDDEVGYRFDIDPWTMSSFARRLRVGVRRGARRRAGPAAPSRRHRARRGHGVHAPRRHARPGCDRVRAAVHRPPDRPGQPPHARGRRSSRRRSRSSQACGSATPRRQVVRHALFRDRGHA